MKMHLLWSGVVLSQIIYSMSFPLFGDSNIGNDSILKERGKTPKAKPTGNKNKELERIKELLRNKQDKKEEPGFHSEAPNATHPTEDNIMCGTDQLPEEESRNFTAYPVKMWKNGIPYVISENGYSEEDKKFILDTIKKWNEELPMVQFREKTDEDKDYVYIVNGYGCSSNIGRLGDGLQFMDLQRSSTRTCLNERIIFHEFLHAVGFIHEHNRIDRDDYIKVNFKELSRRIANEFKKVEMMEYNLFGPYDYYSLMHYPKSLPYNYINAFEVLKKGIDEDKIGHVDISDTDKQKVKALYKYFNKK